MIEVFKFYIVVRGQYLCTVSSEFVRAKREAGSRRYSITSINLMETLIQDINHGFLYTHKGQLETEICQVHVMKRQ